MNKNIVIVIVTYGDRKHYLEKVLDTIKELGVDNVIVVSNALKNVDLIINKFPNFDYILNKNNRGSAKGYKQGIIRALEKEADYIYLLDDDNLPESSTLEFLYEQVSRDNKKKQNSYLTAYLSYRPDRGIYKKAIQASKPGLMLKSENSFLGFNIFDRFHRINMCFDENIRVGKVLVAPYGGLFIHKKLVEKIGLPDESYFLYGDDYEYTYRILGCGGEIILCLDSVLTDMENSFHLKESKGILSNRFLKTNSKIRIYYSVFNGLRFESKFVTNKFFYIMNGFIYCALITLSMIVNYRHFWKLKYFYKSIFNYTRFNEIKL